MKIDRKFLFSYAVIAVLLVEGCADTPKSTTVWHDTSGGNRGDPEMQADYASCQTERRQAYVHAEVQLRNQPPSPSNCDNCANAPSPSSLLDEQAFCRYAENAFINCMQVKGWRSGKAAP